MFTTNAEFNELSTAIYRDGTLQFTKMGHYNHNYKNMTYCNLCSHG